MPSSLSLGLTVFIVLLAWVYDLFNGMNDAANAIATTISTRALRPTQAIALARTMNILGALVTTRVATTIGRGIIKPEAMTMAIVVSALVGAASWAWLCTYYGIPISITHSLVGGMIGAGLVAGGPGVLVPVGLFKVAWGLVLSPVAGLVAGYLLMVALAWAAHRTSPARANRFFRGGQVLSAMFMAFSHGSNDTQNAMGIITAALVAGGFLSHFQVPLWVMLGSALWMGIGTQLGGWRVIRTLGVRLGKLEPVHGFAAEVSSGAVILGATLLGVPISTTHVITSAVMGVGATKRLSAVRWGVAMDIVLTWIFTFPGSALIAAFTYYAARAITG